MRMSTEEKARSRERILAAAGRLFRERGVEGASVGDIMGAASMTHGGFYRHFDGKDDLLGAALAEAFAAFARPLEDSPGPAATEAFRAGYLTMEHRAAPGDGCPAAALGADVARAGPEVRAAFGAGVERIAAGLAGGAGGGERALADLAMMVGAMVLARACPDDLAARVLAACADRPA